MAYNVLQMGTPTFGGVRVEKNDSAGRVAAAIESLQKSFTTHAKLHQIEADQQSVREANADIVRGAVDPNRVRDDMYYAATITRNEVHNQVSGIEQELENPTSKISMMHPDEFSKYLQDQANDFYKKNQSNKHSDVTAGVFNKTLKTVHPKLVAKHAFQFKTRMKAAQSNEAIKALSSIPAEIQNEAFSANTDELIKTVLPNDLFTTDEQRRLIMGAATNGARRGDRRLLDYAVKHYQVDQLDPAEHASAENFYIRHTKQTRKTFWNNEYKRYAEKAQRGEFTKMDWDDLIVNQEALDNLGGRSVIDGWLAAGNKARANHAAMAGFYDDFTTGHPMVGATPKQQNKVIEMTFAEGAKNGEDFNTTMDRVAELIGDQGWESSDLKDTISSALGRQVWTPEVATNDQFIKTYTIASALDTYMSDERLQRQMGEQAYDNYKFIEGELKFNQGDFSSAVTALAQATQKRKQAGLETHLSTDEYDQIRSGVQGIFSGDIKTSDPSVTKFMGWVSKADNAMLSGTVRADVQGAAERLILRGWSPDRAIEQAVRKVAANYGQFGGELHYTGGASPGVLFGLPSGTSEDEMEDAWSFYAKGLGYDSDEIAPSLAGGLLTIVDKETGKELPAVPAAVIGELWEAEKLRKVQEQQAISEADKITNEQEANDLFNQMLYHKFGHENGKTVFTKYKGQDIKIEDYERADRPLKSVYRQAWYKEFTEGERRFFSMFKRVGDWGRAAVGWLAEYQPPWMAPETEKQAPRLTAEEQAEYEKLSPEQKQMSQTMQKQMAGKLTEEDITEEQPKEETYSPQATTRIQRQIIEHEGFRGAPYDDSVGVRTIGYGRNLEANPITDEEWAALGGKRDLTKEPLTEREARILFHNDYRRAQNAASTLFRRLWSRLSEVRQEVLIDMAFNLGAKKLAKFEGMYRGLDRGDYDMAAEEMIWTDPKDHAKGHTKWYDQVGDRAKTLVRQMREGKI